MNVTEGKSLYFYQDPDYLVEPISVPHGGEGILAESFSGWTYLSVSMTGMYAWIWSAVDPTDASISYLNHVESVCSQKSADLRIPYPASDQFPLQYLAIDPEVAVLVRLDIAASQPAPNALAATSAVGGSTQVVTTLCLPDQPGALGFVVTTNGSMNVDCDYGSYDMQTGKITWSGKGALTLAYKDGIVSLNNPVGFPDSWDFSAPVVQPDGSWSVSLSDSAKTYYPMGQHVFFDGSTNSDRICATATTAVSGHLVGLFTTIRTGSYTSVYGKVITANGAMPPPFLIPEETNNYQKDAGIAVIDGTDDFVAVWTSNTSGNYRTYLRRFRVAANGTTTPVSSTRQLSDSSGDYMAPRVVYNADKDLFMVLWVAVTSKQIQFQYLSYDSSTGQFADESYVTTLNDTVSNDYYTTTLDLSNDIKLSLCLIQESSHTIAALKRSTSEVGLYEFSMPIKGNVIQKLLPVYSVSNVSYFDIAYDPDGYIKIVFMQTSVAPVYGDNITYFGVSQVVGAPVQLNQLYQTCGRPTICAAVTAGNSSSYYVAWETANYGVFYNRFYADFIAQGPESDINNSDSTSDNPQVTITDNQLAGVFNAAKNDSVALGGGDGILVDFYNR